MFLSSFASVIFSAATLIRISDGIPFNGERFEWNSFYAIQSASDNTYLKNLNNYDERFGCEDQLSDVITTRSLNSSSSLFRWYCEPIQFLGLPINNSIIHIISETNDENEVSYSNKLYIEDEDYPVCHGISNNFYLTQIVDSTVMIERDAIGECLTNIGIEKRIRWENCTTANEYNKNQFWKFIQLEN